MIFMAYQASKAPAESGASVPPAMTMSASPSCRNCMAMPMACPDEAQTLDATKQGPEAPVAFDTQLAEELTAIQRHGQDIYGDHQA